MKRMFIIILVLVLLAGTASAVVEYGDGWRKECFDNSKCQYSNYHTIQRWDGQYIPYKSLNLSTEQWPYQLLQNDTHFNIRNLNEWLNLSKNLANYSFDLTDISLSFTVTPAQLDSKSTANGSGLWYIPIPDKAVKTRFLWDNKKPIVYRNGNQSDILDVNTYWYSVSGDQRRLNYNQTARNFGIASTNVTFVFDSWTVGSGGRAWSGNSTFNNTAQLNNDGNVVVGTLYSNFESNDNKYIAGVFEGTKSTNWQRNSGTAHSGTWKWKTGADAGQYQSDEITSTLSINSTMPLSTNINLSWWHSIAAENDWDGGVIQYYNNLTSVWVTIPYGTSGMNYNNGSQGCWYNGGYAKPCYTGAISMTYYQVNVTSYINQTTGFLGIRFVFGADNGATDLGWIIDDVELRSSNKGNLTTWYDSGANNETYQLDVNVTTPANTNYTVTAYNNATGAFLETLGTNLSNNQSLPVNIKVRDYRVNITLNGNTTATPELIEITFFTQMSVTVNSPIPPTPINCLSANGTTWINVSCSAGSGNITNGMNFTNTNTSSWSNSSAFYWNNTGLSEGTQYNYNIYAWNNSGTGSLSLTYATVTNTTRMTEVVQTWIEQVQVMII